MVEVSFSPWPCFTDEEIDAAASVIRSNRVNYWTGDEGRKFEREFAAWADCSHAVAVANGTVALDLALHGLQIGAANGGSPDDEVIVTPRTFLASVSSVVNAGAVPVFADVDAQSGNLSADTIAQVLSGRTRGIVVVHLAGWPAEMDSILALARPRGIKIIEDCAQAHGARYRDRSVGSFGDVGAWSFCQDKIMTTGGEGGMVTTNDNDIWSRMWSFKDHGKSWEAVYERDHPAGFRWVHESFGTNWRMLEVQAAIGRIQLNRMADWNEARRKNSAILSEAFKSFSGGDGILRSPEIASNIGVHARYRYYSYVRANRLASGWSRDRIVAELAGQGIPCFQGSCSEVYLEKAFDGTGWRPPHRLPVAQELGETSLTWLVHPTLSADEMSSIAERSAEVFAQASA